MANVFKPSTASGVGYLEVVAEQIDRWQWNYDDDAKSVIDYCNPKDGCISCPVMAALTCLTVIFAMVKDKSLEAFETGFKTDVTLAISKRIARLMP